jgi:hypothetical protein
MPLDRLYPIIPSKLPDGTVVWEERGKAFDVQAAVRGYDPRMSFVRNHADGAWEVWRADERGDSSRCGIWPGDRCPEPREVLDHLLGHDVWRGYDPLADYDRTEAMIAAAEDAALGELVEGYADRVHYELIDEFSAHMPAARPIGLHPKGYRKRVSA